MITDCKSSYEGIHIIDFAFHPMVEISEWIPEVFDGVKHGFFECGVIWVIQDELVNVQLGILDSVQIFVVGQNFGHTSIRLHDALFGAEEP